MKRKAKGMGASLSSGSTSSRSVSSAAGQSQENLFDVPLEILEEIFLNLPPHQLVCVCRLVCHQWKEVADSESLWRERCRREGYRLHDASRIPKDWRLFYFLHKMRRNLLKNPRGEDEKKNWYISYSAWKVEGVLVPHPNEMVKTNFVTAHLMCHKYQVINLELEGYNPSFMDDFQPDIKISDWYAPRRGSGSQYDIHVELLNQRHQPVKKFAPKVVYFPRWNDQKWNQVTHVFRNYGPGVRYVRFTHGGRSIHYEDWYGIRVTDSCVEICPAMDA